MDATIKIPTSKSTQTLAKMLKYASEDGWTAELDRDYIFGQSQCIINGEGECHLLCFY